MTATAAPVVERIPNLATIARPPDLLTTVPYILTVTQNGKDFIRIDCSHEPTLELLAAYLKKWNRTNPNDSQRVRIHYRFTENSLLTEFHSGQSSRWNWSSPISVWE